MSRHLELVEAWRNMSPTAWAESPHGWITEAGRPIVLEPWQRAALTAWWAHRETVSTLAISNIKKTGKTLLNAVLTCWRFLVIESEHLICANDLDQSSSRVFANIQKMVKRHPYLKNHCKITRSTIEFLPTGSVLKAVPTDDKGNAGAVFATVSSTESWGIMLESAARQWEELTPIPGDFSSFSCLRIADSYAGYLDESTVWHTLVDAGLEGEQISDEYPLYRNGGILLFHDEGEQAQRYFRGTPERAARYYADQKAQLRPMAYERLHLNQRTAGAEAFVSEDQWTAIETEPGPLPATKKTPLYVGLDLAVKHDTAALVATVPNGSRRARIALHRIWKAPKRGEIQLARVMDFILDLHATHWLAGVFYDPSQAALMAQQLRAKGVPMREVPQSLPELGPRGLALYEAVRDGRLTTYADDELKAAALAAQAREVPQGLHITKGANKARKIDPMAALSFCLPAALEGGNNSRGMEDLGHVDDFVGRWGEPGREIDNQWWR